MFLWALGAAGLQDARVGEVGMGLVSALLSRPRQVPCCGCTGCRDASVNIWPGTGTVAKSPQNAKHPLQHVSVSLGRVADAKRLGQAEENHLSSV